MTKKKILNITAVKKRDNMLCYTNSTASAQSGSTIYSTSLPAVVTGGQAVNAASTFLWCATARDGTTSTAGNLGTRFTLATRTSTSPYMIGVKEAIEIQVPTGMPWQWRRICFTYKGPLGLSYDPGTSIATETTSGWARVTNQIAGDPGSGQQYILFEKLFKGQNTVDWNDVMTAKVDNTRVTLKYDSTCTLSSGNEDGFIRKYNRWHSMYKTLVYDDDELGGGETGRIQSTQGKSGMGDYYIAICSGHALDRRQRINFHLGPRQPSIGTKNRFCYLNEITVLLHPSEVRLASGLVPVLPRVCVATPDRRLAPPQCNLMLVLVGYRKVVLPSHPLLVGWKKSESACDVVKDCIVHVGSEVLEVEQSSEIRVCPE